MVGEGYTAIHVMPEQMQWHLGAVVPSIICPQFPRELWSFLDHIYHNALQLCSSLEDLRTCGPPRLGDRIGSSSGKGKTPVTPGKSQHIVGGFPADKGPWDGTWWNREGPRVAAPLTLAAGLHSCDPQGSHIDCGHRAILP